MTSIEGAEPPRERPRGLRVKGPGLSLHEVLRDPTILDRAQQELKTQFTEHGKPRTTETQEEQGDNDE